MDLFLIENGIVKPAAETLAIYPFKEMWERDQTTHKDRATREFTFIEFCCSYKKTNPYSGYDESIRQERVRVNLYRDQPDWLPDELVIHGMAQYKEFQKEAAPSLKFYEAALIGIGKLQGYYESLDMSLTTMQGTLVNKPSDVARSLSQTAAILQNLESLREKVQQELFESNKIRANRIVNPFER